MLPQGNAFLSPDATAPEDGDLRLPSSRTQSHPFSGGTRESALYDGFRLYRKQFRDQVSSRK